ncbi:MAG TPA: PspC domain-containing protein [Streptosporangiaceae bacterium]|nr:PspC domain-containing protein [Streptosporangiaceae bacterium]
MNSNTEDLHYASQPESAPAGDEPGSSADHERPPLRRPARGRMLAGVSVAIGRHFNVDVTIVRVAFAVLTIVGFTGIPYLGFIPFYLGGIPLYLACWLLIPEEGSEHSIASGFLKHLQSKSR